ncbi:MAG TPA: hypothetical protein OIM63_04755 [Bacilli bacterium]|nr:hypothetical protein [Bacilli bacterium]
MNGRFNKESERILTNNLETIIVDIIRMRNNRGKNIDYAWLKSQPKKIILGIYKSELEKLKMSKEIKTQVSIDEVKEFYMLDEDIDELLKQGHLLDEEAIPTYDDRGMPIPDIARMKIAEDKRLLKRHNG